MPLSDLEQRVCAAIQAGSAALLDDLRLHVGLPTGGRNTAALDETRDRLTRRAAALEARVELIPGVARPEWLYGETPGQEPLPVAVCRRRAGGLGREVLLAGHLDTVHDPRGPFRSLTLAADGATATGPGCVDMKGGLVIALAALEALDNAGITLNWTLLLNSDEETGSYHSAPAIRAEAARVARAGGVGIALEPATANGGVVVERAGSAQFVVDVRGKAAHVGRDFAAGVSAVNELAAVVLELSRLSSPAEGLIVNIGPLEGGAATNVVPDRARAWGNVRFSRPEQLEEFERRARSCTGPRPSGAVVALHVNCGRPAKPETAGVRDLATTVQAAAADLGQPLPLARTAGVCDGNLMQAEGLATLDTLGVRGGGLHTAQEWIEIPSLVSRCQLLAVSLMRLSRAG